VYGSYLTHRGAVLSNEAGGHLVRSKFAEKLDGGVAAGVAMLDSPILVDSAWW
jgi:glutathione synthase